MPVDTAGEALQGNPRLAAHLICASLGYFTPRAAANAIAHHAREEPFFCEWYVHMARGYNEQAVLEVGKERLQWAFHNRHSHRGYMKDYKLARQLVEASHAGEYDRVFASWF